MRSKAAAVCTFRPGPTRGEMIHDSDAVCRGCGADPRTFEPSAVTDPRWSVQAVRAGKDGWVTVIRCPACVVLRSGIYNANPVV